MHSVKLQNPGEKRRTQYHGDDAQETMGLIGERRQVPVQYFVVQIIGIDKDKGSLDQSKDAEQANNPGVTRSGGGHNKQQAGGKWYGGQYFGMGFGQ